MPFVHIHLLEGKPKTFLQSIADGVHEALVEACHIPQGDRFQVISEFKKHQFIVDKTYFDIERSDDAVIIHITLKIGRSHDIKKALYQAIVTKLASHPGLRKEDVMIILADNDPGNWSFGNGIAQLIS